MTLRSRTALAASVLGAALVAWIVTVQRMWGMDAGPGTDLGELGWYVGIWVTMMAAMVALPGSVPGLTQPSSGMSGGDHMGMEMGQ